jgi:hypothetical protein
LAAVTLPAPTAGNCGTATGYGPAATDTGHESDAGLKKHYLTSSRKENCMDLGHHTPPNHPETSSLPKASDLEFEVRIPEFDEDFASSGDMQRVTGVGIGMVQFSYHAPVRISDLRRALDLIEAGQRTE